MHDRIDPPPQLLSTATEQGGVVSAEQITMLDFNLRSAERLVVQRSWQRLATGVYYLGVGEPTWDGLAWAGVFLGGQHARLGFDAAAYLWQLTEDPPRPIRVLVPRGRQVADRGPWRFHRESACNRSTRAPKLPPRTTVEDTVIDLCVEATPRELAGLLTKAVQSQRTTAERLLLQIEARPRVRHRSLLLQMLTDVDAGAESPLEVRYVRDVERPHGLPPALRQARSSSGSTVRDMLYEEYATIIELDGRTHIPGRFRDMRRDNRALLHGAGTLRYGWPDVTEEPCRVAWQVAALLSLRGWPGLPTRCERCCDLIESDLASTW